jgi:hypothetical protein
MPLSEEAKRAKARAYYHQNKERAKADANAAFKPPKEPKQEDGTSGAWRGLIEREVERQARLMATQAAARLARDAAGANTARA